MAKTEPPFIVKRLSCADDRGKHSNNVKWIAVRQQRQVRLVDIVAKVWVCRTGLNRSGGGYILNACNYAKLFSNVKRRNTLCGLINNGQILSTVWRHFVVGLGFSLTVDINKGR
jgi:hypothetical protein